MQSGNLLKVHSQLGLLEIQTPGFPFYSILSVPTQVPTPAEGTWLASLVTLGREVEFQEKNQAEEY